MCLEVKVKLPCVASVLLHAVAKMVVGLPEALSVSAFPARDLLVGILRSRIHSAIRETAIQNYDKELANEVLQVLAENETWQIPTLALNTRSVEKFYTDPEWQATFTLLPDSIEQE